MKNLLLLPLLLLFVFSCTKDSILTGEDADAMDNLNLTELEQYESQLSAKVDGLVAAMESMASDQKAGDLSKGGGNTFDPCVHECNVDYTYCFGSALDDKDWSLNDCESIRITGFTIEDVICTRSILVGYDITITPEGEEIQLPIYEQEEYVCGQREVPTLSDDPEILAAYHTCRIQALEAFVDAVDQCDIDKVLCLRKCNKGPITPF